MHNQNRNDRKWSNHSGFTLVELMIVIIIIGLIASIVAPNIIKRLDRAKQNTAVAQIESLSQALDTYRLDMDRYPTTQEGLKGLLEKPSSNGEKWDGPYLSKEELPKDPWGNAYQYKSSGDNKRPFEITSLGSDGKEGGEDIAQDIVNYRSMRK